nr:heme peroxidase family protein [uncultured Roseibium sp.]
MLNVKGHGGHTLPDKANYNTGRTTVSTACGFANQDYPDWDEAGFGSFGYFFEDAAENQGGAEMTKLLNELAVAMVENPPSAADDSSIPPVFTYLGQFIDHDVTAGTDREEGLSEIDAPVIETLPRPDVRENVGNLRHGALNLDSVYGGGPVQGDFATVYDNALRFPGDRSKLWAGTVTSVPGQTLDLPADPAADLLRLDRVLKANLPGFSEQDLRDLPHSLTARFFTDKDGEREIIPQQAIIGDARNDENLFVAQLHLAFIRLHNKIVDVAHLHGGPVHDKQELFTWARRELQYIYQWLVVNVYLPKICDPLVVADVLAAGAPVFEKLQDNPRPAPAPSMRLPFEFSVAGFRFGHSMVRAAYDWNKFFGREEPGEPNLLPEAPFSLMFQFTGNGKAPMRGELRLPSNWVADWSRLALPDQGHSDRATRKIDSKVALPLQKMDNEPDGKHQPMKDLMVRNLLRGLRLNVPSAQDCIKGFADQGIAINPLSRDELLSDGTGDVIRGTLLEPCTPLWFYVLKEAEIQGKGQHLGELGSRIVAETLAGLAIYDPNSYWHQPGSDNGRWHPRDGAQPNGEPVVDMPSMLRAAALL